MIDFVVLNSLNYQLYDLKYDHNKVPTDCKFEFA